MKLETSKYPKNRSRSFSRWLAVGLTLALFLAGLPLTAAEPPAEDGQAAFVPARHLEVTSPLAGGTLDLEEAKRPDRRLLVEDLNADGTPDVLITWWEEDSGRLEIRLGETADAGEGAPSFEKASAVELAVRPEWLGTGDFDGDGHLDLVVAARRGRALHWFLGDGEGGLDFPQTLAVPGEITALLAGRILDRPDGVVQVAVALADEESASLFLTDGLVRGGVDPRELVALPAEASAFVLGRFGDAMVPELLTIAGGEVFETTFESRRIDDGESVPFEDFDARLERLPFDGAATSLAAGDFLSGGADELAVATAEGLLVLARPNAWSVRCVLPAGASGAALFAARTLGAGFEELVVADLRGGTVEILASDAAGTACPVTVSSRTVADGLAGVVPITAAASAFEHLLVLGETAKARSTPSATPRTVLVTPVIARSARRSSRRTRVRDRTGSSSPGRMPL